MEVVLAIDGVCIYWSRKKGLSHSPSKFRRYLVASQKYNLHKYKGAKSGTAVLPLKLVGRVEKAIYDPAKFYMWYLDPRGKTQRVDFEMFDVGAMSELITRIQFILKNIKRILPYV